MAKKNILFIMTDEQRFDDISYINSAVSTKQLDLLARDSIAFTNAYTTNPSCIPARAAIMTGRYPSSCGAPTFITPLPKNEKTFMQLLREGGYYTAVIGKQHFWTSEIERGYDYMDIVDEHCPLEEFNSPDSSYMKFLANDGFKHTSELSEHVSAGYVCKWKQDKKYYVDEYIGDKALCWLEKDVPKDKPWFLTLSFPGPHMPFDGIGLPEQALYDINDIPLPKTTAEDIFDKPQYYQDLQQHFCEYETDENGEVKISKRMTDEQIKMLRLSYYANTSLIDRKIGETIALLKEKNLYDDTMIIFTSDHGDYMGDFGMAFKGQYLSEALIHIPFILKPPIKGFKGRIESSYISSVEIAATCLACAELAIPPNIVNRSLLGFACEENDVTIPKYSESYAEARDIRSIKNDDYKLIYYAKRTYGELYDMKTDPHERHNLWDNPEYSAIKADLTRLLLDKIIFLGENISVPWNINAPEI